MFPFFDQPSKLTNPLLILPLSVKVSM